MARASARARSRADSRRSLPAGSRTRPCGRAVCRGRGTARPGRRLQPLEQVVVGDRRRSARRRARAHMPRRSSSMTLCSSSFASPICSRTSAMSIVGRAGRARALAVDAVLADHRQRVGQQIERHREHGRAAAPIIVSCCLERVACLSNADIASAFPRRLGRANLDAARQASRRVRHQIRRPRARRPPAHQRPLATSCSRARRTPCSTDPGRTYATRMPS